MPYAIGIAGWFNRGRGAALAIAVSGVGLGHIVLPSTAEWLLGTYDWRAVYLAAAAYVAALGVFALVALYRDPPVQTAVANKMRLPSFAQIYRESRDIRSIAIAIFLISFASLGLSVSLPSMMTDSGFTSADAALVLTVYGIANWIAKLVTGFLIDRIHLRYVAAAIFMLAAGAGLLLLASSSFMAFCLAGVLVGCAVGAEADIMSFAVSRYYEPSMLGKAVGAVWMLMPWGAGLGILSGAVGFDVFNGHQVSLAVYALFAAAAALVIFRLGPYRDSGTTPWVQPPPAMSVGEPANL